MGYNENVYVLVGDRVFSRGQREYINPQSWTFLSPGLTLLTPSAPQTSSHVSSNGAWPLPGLHVLFKLFCCHFRKWHAYTLDTNSKRGNRTPHVEWDCNTKSLELPAAHESLPAAGSCDGSLHRVHEDKPYGWTNLGAAAAAGLDADFR